MIGHRDGYELNCLPFKTVDLKPIPETHEVKETKYQKLSRPLHPHNCEHGLSHIHHRHTISMRDPVKHKSTSLWECAHLSLRHLSKDCELRANLGYTGTLTKTEFMEAQTSWVSDTACPFIHGPPGEHGCSQTSPFLEASLLSKTQTCPRMLGQ